MTGRTIPRSLKRSRDPAERKSANKTQKRREIVFDDPSAMVTFIVGDCENSAKFNVHKDVVCQRSPVLDAAFNGPFEEGETQTYHLDDISVMAFKLMIPWLYGQKLPLLKRKKGEDGDDSDWDLFDDSFDYYEFDTDHEVEDENTEYDDEDMALAQLWVIADKYQIWELQNDVISSMKRISDHTHQVATKTVPYIYKNTTSHSKLRQYIIDSHAVKADARTCKAFKKYYPSRFLRDIAYYAIRAFRDNRGYDRRELDVEKYWVAEPGSLKSMI